MLGADGRDSFAALNLAILTFHSLDEQASAISFSPRLFEKAIARLDSSGCRVLDLAEVVESLRGKGNVPYRSVVITFDDGYQTVYDHAFPILRRYHMPATVFLTTGERQSADSTTRLPNLNWRAMLNWDEIREMRRYGIAFGAHSLTHSDLRRLSTENIEREMRESKDIIQQALGVAIDLFAYPFGRYDPRCRVIARRFFACACTDELGFVRPASDPYALERIDAYYMRSTRFFGTIDTLWFRNYIRARSVPRRIRRAIFPA